MLSPCSYRGSSLGDTGNRDSRGLDSLVIVQISHAGREAKYSFYSAGEGVKAVWIPYALRAAPPTWRLCWVQYAQRARKRGNI
nr:hypothetical protein CFP56_63366 [Quercus suber]POE94790.1 hypothetical protein CFP56_17027 [Quercus suber]